MTKNRWLILCLLLGLLMPVRAAELVATIKAYNKAELSGDVPAETEVTFDNTGGSKGQLTAGSVATMTFTDLPQCTISKVTFYVKSNAKSGAGGLAVSLGGAMIGQISASNFCDWPGTSGYSTTFVPVAFTGAWNANKGSSMICQIAATVNSIGWDKVVITYYETAPDPRTVTFQWFDTQSDIQTKTVTEKSSASGILIPDCPVTKVVSEDEWSFVGWTTERFVGTYTSEPASFKVGEKFYPSSDNQILYALYTLSPEVTNIIQTTDFVSGEYAMVMHSDDNYYMANNDIDSLKLKDGTKKNVLYTYWERYIIYENGLYKLTKSYIPENCRFQITFTKDSLHIRSLLTGNVIGHSGIYLANNNVKWAWQEAKNHSLEISYDSQDTGKGISARVLWLSDDESFPYFETQLLKLGYDYEYILLFDVSDAPTTPPKTRWTGYPFGWKEAVENTSVLPVQARKILRNGVLYIEINNAKYDMLGNKID